MTKRKLLNIKKQKDDGYEYHQIKSIGQTKMYGKNLTAEEYENRHMDHIISDYEEDDFEIIDAECEYSRGIVVMNFNARRKL